MLMALMPAGRAWQSSEGSISFEVDEATVIPGSTLRAFWWAISGPWKDAEDAVGALENEIFAATVSGDKDQWLEELGLPSTDDPYGEDFAAKMRSSAADTPATYQTLLANIGWSTTIRWLTGSDATFPGVFATLYIQVDTAASTAADSASPHVGSPSFRVGYSTLGTADITRVAKIMERIIPAHTAVIVS